MSETPTIIGKLKTALWKSAAFLFKCLALPAVIAIAAFAYLYIFASSLKNISWLKNLIKKA